MIEFLTDFSIFKFCDKFRSFYDKFTYRTFCAKICAISDSLAFFSLKLASNRAFLADFS